MNIELKSLRIFLPGSRETTNFVADIYVNGIKAGYASNDGGGGCTGYSWYGDKPEQRKLIEQAEAYCLTLPPEMCDSFGGEPFEIKSNLENFIDNIVDAELNKKEKIRFEKKMQKDMLKNLLFTKTAEGKPIMEYGAVSWKATIAEMLASEKGRAAIQRVVAEQKEKGCRLLNTNIPAELIAITNKETVQ